MCVVMQRYAWVAISEWQCNQGVTQQGMIGSKPLKEAASVRMRRAHSEFSFIF